MDIKKFKLLIRWQDWALDKLPVLFGLCFFLILTVKQQGSLPIVDFLVFLVFSISSSIFGYVINNFADMEIDLKQGKDNLLTLYTRTERAIMIIVITLVVLISGIYFIYRPGFLYLWILQFLLSTFYSLPPIRLKERGLYGLLAPFIGQLVLPTLICFSIFGNLFSFYCIIFTTYGFFKGGAYDIGHQFYDYLGDKSTKTLTFAVKHGNKLVGSIFKSFLIIERSLFLFILVYLSIEMNGLKKIPFLFLLAIYLLILFSVVAREIKVKKILDPYYADTRGTSNILHIIIPNIVFPMLILLQLTIQNNNYIILLLFFTIWIMPTPSKLLWPIKAVLKK